MRMRVDICIKCIRKARGTFSKEDKLRLQKNIIICPYNLDEGTLKEPPNNCPYRLEHVIDSETPNALPEELVDIWFKMGENGIIVPRD